MTKRTSAGIVLFRGPPAGSLEVLLAHPGGPFFAKKDEGVWSIPKGEPDTPDEALLDIAQREFAEETGHLVPDGPRIPLGSIVQKGGKVVHGWAVQGDLDPEQAVSMTFEMVWPPHSGTTVSFPEIDRVAWFDLDEARKRVKSTQVPLLDRLEAALRDERSA
jgi:predicted NUDIX family NTP pyrophosphohydrolase